MKTYKLKLKALSPIHIGTGETYEPTNYVIDSAPAKIPDGTLVSVHRLFEFDGVDLYKALDEKGRQEFDRIVSLNDPNARFKLYDFIHNKNIDKAKRVAKYKYKVDKDVYDDYKEKIGKVVQKEGKGKSVFNEFLISKTYKLPNNGKPIVLGSSLKGSISTAYQELLYKEKHNYEVVKKIMLEPNDDNLFKRFIVSDSMPPEKPVSTTIGMVVNIKRNKETKPNLPTRLELIAKDTEFITSIKLDEQALDMQKIAKSCNDHYMPIFKSLFNDQTDSQIYETLSDDFYGKYNNWSPANNQFLVRIGKHSGARAVTVDGVRAIKIMAGKGKEPKTAEEETTTWLYESGDSISLPLGWLLCEIID
ncbi:type III-A CRISPR-associated RAMP protein Csm5 [Campylobacterota bacterium]|nr:type III-A CRISPR-associated RAMP protein Csm5 [Campylobacterota bacterium]